jgi:hypothetical protein
LALTGHARPQFCSSRSFLKRLKSNQDETRRVCKSGLGLACPRRFGADTTAMTGTESSTTVAAGYEMSEMKAICDTVSKL